MAAPAHPPGSSSGLTLSLRVVERELRVFRHTWHGVAFSLFIQPLLYLGAMGLGLGGVVDDRVDAGSAASDLDGLEYLQFVAPGLLVASAFMAAAGDSLWPVLGGVKWGGQFKGVIATEVAPRHVFAGWVWWSGLRAAFAASVFLAIAAALGAVPSAWGILAVIPATALAVAATAAMSAYAVSRDTDATFPLIMRLGVVPLFLLSGTFFPVDQLPGGLQPLAWLSPLWHGSEVARGATTGDLAVVDLLHLGVVVAIAVAVWPVGTRNFARVLTP